MDNKNKQYECGVLLGVNYKYGKTPHLFDDLNTTLSLIEKYPILINYLPLELKSDKQVVLTFIRANDSIVKSYVDAMDQSVTEMRATSSNIIRARMANAFRDACPYGIPDGILEPFCKDVDVLAAVANSSMWEDFYITREIYDETIAEEVASKAPQFACVLYDYWQDEMHNQPKVANSIAVKYKLRSDVPTNIVALYKCIDVLNGGKHDCRNALGFLLANVSGGCWDDNTKECRKELAIIFRDMDLDVQNYLASLYYPLIAFIRADDLDEDLAKEVSKNCPIAASLLPDSYILKHNLQVLDVGEDEDICAKCQRCFWCNVHFV